MATPHNEAQKEEIAKNVILTGDPSRATFIAQNYLENYKCVNKVRGIYAYTGYYKGTKVTIMAHGMGIPSMAIYSYELYKFYNVENIIRIGTAGSYTKDLNVLDLLLVTSSYSESTYAEVFDGSTTHEINANKELNNHIKNEALAEGLTLVEGKVHSSDAFYTTSEIYTKMNEEKHLLAVEMESYALFKNAEHFGKKASCILTISDSFITKKELTSKERTEALDQMIKLALNTIINC